MEDDYEYDLGEATSDYDYDLADSNRGSTLDSDEAELSTTGNYELTNEKPGVYGDDESGKYYAVSDKGEKVPMTKEQFDTYNQDPNSFDWKKLGKDVVKALPQVLSIGTNVYGSYRADQLARGYEKSAKDYTKKGEDLIASNLEYTKGKQTLYEQQMQEAMAKQNKAMDLTLNNALRTEKLLNNWTSVFGGVEEHLSNYYNNLDEDTLATFRVNEINQQVAKSKQSLAQVFAQRGLASSGAEAEAMLNLEFSSAYKKADSIYQSKLDTIKQKEDWYKTGQVNRSNLLSANNQAIGQYGQLANSQTSQYGTLANNAMTNVDSANKSAVNFYNKQADYNYTQAGNMNAAAYGMAQNVGHSTGSSSSGGSSSSKDTSIGGSLKKGMAAGMATGNPYVALGVATTDFVANTLDRWF